MSSGKVGDKRDMQFGSIAILDKPFDNTCHGTQWKRCLVDSTTSPVSNPRETNLRYWSMTIKRNSGYPQDLRKKHALLVRVQRVDSVSSLHTPSRASI